MVHGRRGRPVRRAGDAAISADDAIANDAIASSVVISSPPAVMAPASPDVHRRRLATETTLPLLAVVAVVLVCLRSFLEPGYALTTDAVFGPRATPVAVGFGAPVGAALSVLTTLAGGDVAGRAYAAVALLLCGVGALLALRRAPWFARTAAALLAVLNPWVYDRMADGQWGVVAAAGGLLFWLAAWDRLVERPSPARVVLLVLATLLVAAFSENLIGPLVVLAAGAVVGRRVALRRRGGDSGSGSHDLDGARTAVPGGERWVGIALLASAVVLLYGVVPFLLGHGPGTYEAVRRFGDADFRAFRASGSPGDGVWVNLVGLLGYWGERLHRFPLAIDEAPWWPVSTAILVSLAFAGAWLRRHRRWLLLVGVVGLAVAGSTATGPGLAAVEWLATRVPLVAGYRDPTKWSALWLVALVVLGGEAIAELAARPRTARLGPCLAALMVGATLAPAGWFQLRQLPAQLQPVRYPADWYAAADWLARHVPAPAPVVVLPWHLYKSFPFTGHVVADPAVRFFPGTLLVSQDPDLPGAPPPTDPLGAAARHPEDDCRLAAAVRAVGARWVVVEEANGAAEDVEALTRCGFVLVEGDGTRTSVLQG